MDEMITIRKHEYERLKEAAEDLADIIAYGTALAQAGEPNPAHWVKRMIDGEGPVRVFRELREFTEAELGARSGINRVFIAEIESGRKSGSIETIRKLADALSVTIDDLV